MTHRVLPPHEWPRLAGTELEAVYPYLNPDHADVVVVEDEGRVVGCWAFVRVFHADGAWIHPDQRGGMVAQYLLRGIAALARLHGSDRVVATAESDDVAHLLQRLGGEQLPGAHFVLPVGGQ